VAVWIFCLLSVLPMQHSSILHGMYKWDMVWTVCAAAVVDPFPAPTASTTHPHTLLAPPPPPHTHTHLCSWGRCLKRLRCRMRQGGSCCSRMRFWASCRQPQASQANLSAAANISTALRGSRRVSRRGGSGTSQMAVKRSNVSASISISTALRQQGEGGEGGSKTSQAAVKPVGTHQHLHCAPRAAHQRGGSHVDT
jgi:hypothetical protein